jgi:hypothetical protein
MHYSVRTRPSQALSEICKNGFIAPGNAKPAKQKPAATSTPLPYGIAAGTALVRRPFVAYAETNGLAEILSEDFSHNQLYGNVRIVNPFA